MRKSLILLTAAAWLLLLCGPAAAFGDIAYPDRPLNLRASRSAKAKWVGSLHPGQQVRIGFEKDGWVAVFEPDETRANERVAVGYSNVRYLLPKRTRHEPEQWGEFVRVVRNLNVRDQASVKGRRLDMLKAGEVVKIDFPEGDWTLVFKPGATIRSELNGIGYASAKYFQPAKPPAPEPAVAPEPTPEPAPVSAVVDAGSGHGQVGSKVAPPPAAPEPPAREAARIEPAPVPAPAPAPVAVSPAVPVRPAEQGAPPDIKAEDTGRKTIVIDRSRFKGTKRADPVPDQTAHGYQYRLLEKSETKQYGTSWITIKIFLSTKTLPSTEALRDFATTLWKEHRQAAKSLAVLIYLPGMDTGDLSYGVIQFDDARLLEFWVRKTTLFGTDFL
ncbi:MAG: SH3 domain-containing protein [Pseudodesulfovibrio sp.]